MTVNLENGYLVLISIRGGVLQIAVNNITSYSRGFIKMHTPISPLENNLTLWSTDNRVQKFIVKCIKISRVKPKEDTGLKNNVPYSVLAR